MAIDWSKDIRNAQTKEPLKLHDMTYTRCFLRDNQGRIWTYDKVGNATGMYEPNIENYEPELEIKPMTVDWTKPIQTKRGIPARLLTDKLHCPNGRTYVVAYGGAKHGEGVLACNANGSPEYPDTDEFDIINVPEKRTMYININEKVGHEVYNYPSRKAADQSASLRYRIACVKVEYTVGQFDT